MIKLACRLKYGCRRNKDFRIEISTKKKNAGVIRLEVLF
jgi:hypothetical protein